MALIKCTRCGQMISDKAKACPKCGEPIRGFNETPNEYRRSEQPFPRQDNSINQTRKRKTSPALITTIALLSMAVLALGGFVFYKMVYEPSRVITDQEQEVLIDMSGDDTVDTTAIVEEQPVTVEEAPVAIEEPVDAAADYYISENVWLAQRNATIEDIAGLSSAEIRILRNSIFARHGRYFKDPELQAYFNSQPWYSPYRKEVPIQELNDYERKNIEFLKKHE